MTQITTYQPPSEWWRSLSRPAQGRKPLRGLDAAWDVVAARFVPLVPRRRRCLKRAKRVLKHEAELSTMGTAGLNELMQTLRDRVRRGRDTADDLERAFAVVREQARRVTGLHAYPVQVAAALAIDSGCIAEVATGEGKTLIATMPAVVAGWRGRSCHVITSNDYLAKRDAETMSPVYRACGLNVGYVTGEMDPRQRRENYHADISYTTNKEAAADYLRDRLVMGHHRGLADTIIGRMAGRGLRADYLVQRGLETAIVDEADAVLIDEGMTPLIISGDAPNAELTDAFVVAADAAQHFSAMDHYKVDHGFRELRLTAEGRRLCAQLLSDHGGVWAGARRREEFVTQALTARELFINGKQYVVQDGKAVIIDEYTGRLMPDRTWREGLHQAVEAKEGIEVTPPKDTLARISFQRFFRLYRKLSGMTGTSWEERHELWQMYRTPTVRIPTNKPCIRKVRRDTLQPTQESRWQAVADEIATMHEQGRPVLVGTRSVRASEIVSTLLEERKLAHTVLNAVRHKEEAIIVAQAGQPGAITIATNMAGRGTDIVLGPGISERGGLHVVLTERHDSRRIDRQLMGRAARQGDPGSAAAFVSLEDELIVRYTDRLSRAILKRLDPQTLLRLAQWRSQSRARYQRKGVLKRDQWLAESLGFAGVE
jgi:preprotein translocase subunit SecA